MTAVEFIVNQLDFLNRERKEKLIDAETYLTHKMILVKQAKEMEKQQIEKMYSEEEVIAIVEKSRKTGLTAEYLLLTEQFKKK
jgi:hypothetical protein